MKQKLFTCLVVFFFATTLSATITYELNGGITNDYGWQSKNDMFQACMADCGITTLPSLDELKAPGVDGLSQICTPFNESACQTILDNPKWDWLEAYIMLVQNADVTTPATQLTEGVASGGWRYAVAAFFLESQRTSWPRSADFSQAGKVEVFMPYWKHGFDNPTNPSKEVELNIPYNEGETFEGWYMQADFSGEQVTKVDASTTGTLYAKWTDNVSSVHIYPNDASMGSVSRSGIYPHNSEITISATPNFGYHFVQWSDGNTDNPRTLIVKQDITLTAEFAQSFSGQCGDNLYWSYDETTKTISISGSGEMYDYTADSIPWLLFREQIVGLTTSNTVTSIGSYAFYKCSSLTSVTIGKSVTSIGNYAFQDCSSLNKTNYTGDIAGWCNIMFGNGYANPMYYSHNFYINDQEIKDLVIPNSVTSIGKHAFYGCSSLTSVTIPNSVTSIEYSAFCGCSSLTSVTIGESVTSIGYYAFSSCSSLTSVTIPNSVTSIGYYAFSSCSSLTSITIPNSVTSIGENTFWFCSSLTSVTIGESVTSIGDFAFYECSSLTSITCEAETPATLGNWVFSEVSKSIPVYVPCGCVKAYKAASGWKAFTNIQESLAEYSIEVYVNDTIMGTAKVDYNTFCEGNQISATPNIGYHFVQWSDGVTESSRTLELTQDTILTAEFAQSFSGQCGDSLYWELVDTTLHITGKGEMYDYKSDSAPWKLLVSSIKMLTIAEDVTKLSHSFGSCSVLESVVWNARHAADAYSEGQYVYPIFYGIRSQIKSFSLGENVEYIPTYLCDGMDKLTSMTIPNSVTSIGNRAFRDCSSLTSVTIPNSVTSIGTSAFYGCSSLTSVTIGESVTSIEKEAFKGCSSLKSITCEAETPATLGNWVFSGVSKSIPVYVPCGCIRVYKNATYWYDFTNIQEPLAKYSIEVNVNDSIMGTAEVDKNNGCGAQISATPNIGYHFVQWSDGNTDAIRTLALTQDTVLTAEFAINQYTVTTRASHSERGTTQGDTTVNYSEYITISATANYGYHFTQWSDGVTDNPRQVQVTGNTTYTATFAKNTYAISLSCNEEQGSVEGVTSAEYLDTVTISATPNIGYHFVQWSDGNTDAIRTLELTQDTILIAEFAQSFSGQCGDSLYWELVDTTLHITGKGEMYDYESNAAPWKLLVSSIKVLTIVEDVTKLSQSFDSCSVLESIVWNAKNCADASLLETAPFYAIRSQITSFTFGENVEYIPTYLCAGMDKLTSMTIPNSVTSIGSSAFYYCSSLTSVTIPNSVTSIGDAAFRDCSSLTSVTIPNSVTSIGDDAFRGCSSLTSVTIPNSVTSIGYYAFSFCESLTSVTIGNSVKSIGYYAFSVCDNITSVTWNAKNCNTYNFGSQVTSFEFGNEVEVVPSSLCKGMEKLTSVTIPNSVKTIGTSAFEGCARLGKISLGTGLEEIAAYAFASCTRLYDIYCHAVYPPFVDESSFANYNAYLYIPCDSKRDYTLDPVWGKFQHIECLSNEETDVENVDTSSQQQTNCQKIIRNGQLLILRDGVEYTVMGQEL